MRLHRLRLTAFGPFPGTEEVAFDPLADAGLFLVQGPTGAGKTSVLDAVCFALYGTVPGARNQAKSLHSDHAPRDRAPEVVVEATIRGRRLRIARMPRWTRPKRRGEGVTEVQPKVTVEELVDGEWIVRATRLDEAGQLIRGLLGMSAEQFCQVALLPQGEFARFLRAGAEERREVLEQLFATDVFGAVERWLAERRTATGREAEELRRAAESVADRIAEAAGVARPEAGEQPDDLAGLLSWAAELETRAERDLQTAEHDFVAAARAVEQARAAAAHARGLADRQHRHAQARERLAALEARAGERAQLAAALDAASRADRVMPLLRSVDQRSAEAEKYGTLAAEALAAATPFVPSPGASGSARTPAELVAALLDAERARRDEIARLDGLRGEATRLREVEEVIDALAATRRRLAEEEQDLAARIAELPDRRAALDAELTRVRVRAAGRPAAQGAVDAARRRLAAAERLCSLTAELAAAEERRRAAVDAAQQALDRLQSLRQARIAGMAAELAAGLDSGRPCPVCGSVTHPAPAAPVAGSPSAADEEDAQRAYEAAGADRERATRREAELRAEVAQEAEAAAGRDVAAARAELDHATAELDRAVAAEQAHDALAAELKQAEEELERVRARHAQVGRERTAADARHAALVDEATRIRARLDAARGGDPTIEARAGRIAHEAGQLRDAAEAIQRAQAAEGELDAAREAAAAAAREAGFPDAAAARAAALGEAARDEIGERLRRFADEEAAVRATLDDPELVAAAAQPAPDVTGLEAVLEAAEEAHTAAVSARDRARRRRTRLGELRTELAARIEAWRPAAARHEVAARLASLTGGTSADNRWRMRLSAYVLAARLEQVVAAANERLARMSSGRYALLHTVDRGVGDRRGGLGLRVSDAWTGQERDPATLSGGETFLTSLALALGLADVVMAEAGGAEIGMLFVDEGFGTLDEETLDEVMDVLDGLRDGGRAVGIVSHVAELRTRIPAQLRVRKGRAGSTLATTV